MATYKAPDNSLHCIDPEFAYMLPAGCVEITEAEAEAIRAAEIPPPQVPQSVTMRQARLALLQANLLTNVQTAINALTEPQKTEAQISWDYSSEIQRNNSFAILLAQALGLTDAQLDELFTTAAQL